ncbi:hypothetical protein F6Q08_06600 [Pectobacterium parmentieri]|nr:hypothetical protein [Pectobacterium parmentieri]
MGMIPLPSSTFFCEAARRLIYSTQDHSTHMMSIWSTPSVSENYAKQIRRNVDNGLAMQKQ